MCKSGSSFDSPLQQHEKGSAPPRIRLSNPDLHSTASDPSRQGVESNSYLSFSPTFPPSLSSQVSTTSCIVSLLLLLSRSPPPPLLLVLLAPNHMVLVSHPPTLPLTFSCSDDLLFSSGEG